MKLRKATQSWLVNSLSKKPRRSLHCNMDLSQPIAQSRCSLMRSNYSHTRSLGQSTPPYTASEKCRPVDAKKEGGGRKRRAARRKTVITIFSGRTAKRPPCILSLRANASTSTPPHLTPTLFRYATLPKVLESYEYLQDIA